MGDRGPTPPSVPPSRRQSEGAVPGARSHPCCYGAFARAPCPGRGSVLPRPWPWTCRPWGVVAGLPSSYGNTRLACGWAGGPGLGKGGWPSVAMVTRERVAVWECRVSERASEGGREKGRSGVCVPLPSREAVSPTACLSLSLAGLPRPQAQPASPPRPGVVAPHPTGLFPPGPGPAPRYPLPREEAGGVFNAFLLWTPSL